jgi:hypothetical protein
MSYLSKLKSYPIDLIFISNYYEKILFTHPKRLKLILLFVTHLLLLITLYIAPLIYNNSYFNLFYACLIMAMICGWILFNGECWINSWEKKILNPNYKNGDNLDVNPSIDFLSINILFPIIDFFKSLFKTKKKEIINEEDYIYYKNLRYKIPLIIPLISFVIFAWTRFKNVKVVYKTASIVLFIILLVITHFRWKSLDKFYK